MSLQPLWSFSLGDVNMDLQHPMLKRQCDVCNAGDQGPVSLLFTITTGFHLPLGIQSKHLYPWSIVLLFYLLVIWTACGQCHFLLAVSQHGCGLYLNYEQRAELYSYVTGLHFINISLLSFTAVINVWIFPSCQQHRVTARWITHSQLFYTRLKHKSPSYK